MILLTGGLQKHSNQLVLQPYHHFGAFYKPLCHRQSVGFAHFRCNSSDIFQKQQ